MIKKYIDMIYSQGFIPLITHPTRITETSSTVIDHIYTNNECYVRINKFNLTDHRAAPSST